MLYNKLFMKKTQKIFLFWLFLVVAWNFGVPEAEPIYDVLVAIILSLFANYIKKKF